VYDNCAQHYAHKYEQLLNLYLVRFRLGILSDSEREDCQARKLNKEDAMDRCKWRRMLKEAR